MSKDGTVYDIWAFGNITASTVVITVTLRLAIDTLYWPWMMFVCCIGSVVSYFVFLLIYGEMYGLSNFDPLYLLFVNQGKAPSFWLTLLILVIIATLPDFSIKWLRQNLYPKDWQIFKEFLLEQSRKTRLKHRTKKNKEYGTIT